MATVCNIASHLERMAQLTPERAAIVERRSGAWRTTTFLDLHQTSDAFAVGLESMGVRRGTRTVLMAPPSTEFFALTFALFKMGAVPVLIDPGIARKSLIACLTEVETEAFVGVPAAHVARLMFPAAFRSTQALVTVGAPKLWGGLSTTQLLARGQGKSYALASTAADDMAAILYTSGSTGVPKGAVYTHGIFDAQVRLIRDTYGIEPGEIDLPTFPLFALFDPALGMTAVLPEMDFRYPAQAVPARLVEAIRQYGCTNMFGSPALIDNLGRYAVEKGIKLPTLRRVLCAGAPVRNDVLDRMSKVLEGGAQVFTPFGATESLPVASIGSHEALGETAARTAAGAGICVGRPVAEMQARIIEIRDEPIATWSAELEVKAGVIGEIAVAGPVVTQSYFRRSEQTALHKVAEGNRVVHRMGDLGYLDEQGRIWMCGRKSHRVVTATGTLFTTQIEEIFNTHPAVRRTALVGRGPRGAERPIVLLERGGDMTMSLEDILEDLRELGARHSATASITDFAFYPDEFPVDRRHNAKIEREKLKAWAERACP